MGAKIYELLVRELHANITNKVISLQQQVHPRVLLLQLVHNVAVPDYSFFYI